MELRQKYKTILREFGKFLISCLCILGIAYIIPQIVCKRPRCVHVPSFGNAPSSGNVFECAYYLSVSCEPRRLILAILGLLTIILWVFGKKKKISISWGIYFLILSIIYCFAGWVVDYVMGTSSL